MYRFVEPAVDRVTLALYNSPDIVVLVFVVLVIALTIQVLAWVRRIMMWWTRLAFRVVFWTFVIGLIAAVWERGLEASLRDAIVIASKIAGYAAAVKDIWMREYQKYDAQSRAGSSPKLGGAGRGGAAFR